eukprot:CAMPEP_0180677298 /NCGR_PEP_ID=MMETSP1037_2-20121125/67774_1 /TAXON_ID=632150 /ORGANISM="Azadinium spinosum, Strain 3D9" /LENGTH=40 /DNA_ID= /DNA_START= /DNA_END= /DNA_ORIENTATION=
MTTRTKRYQQVSISTADDAGEGVWLSSVDESDADNAIKVL